MKTSIYKVRLKENHLLRVVTENPVWDVLSPTFIRERGGDRSCLLLYSENKILWECDGVLGHISGSIKGPLTSNM